MSFEALMQSTLDWAFLSLASALFSFCSFFASNDLEFISCAWTGYAAVPTEIAAITTRWTGALIWRVEISCMLAIDNERNLGCLFVDVSAVHRLHSKMVSPNWKQAWSASNAWQAFGWFHLSLFCSLFCLWKLVDERFAALISKVRRLVILPTNSRQHPTESASGNLHK